MSPSGTPFRDTAGDIPRDWQFGPFAVGLDPGEKVARLRTLRMAVRLLCGSRGAALCDSLRQAEAETWLDDAWARAAALAELIALPALDRRHVLSAYAGLDRTQE